MMNALREELFKLSAAERMELVEDLWDSIAAEGEPWPLTDAQREDLERRVRELDQHPELALEPRIEAIHLVTLAEAAWLPTTLGQCTFESYYGKTRRRATSASAASAARLRATDEGSGTLTYCTVDT